MDEAHVTSMGLGDLRPLPRTRIPSWVATVRAKITDAQDAQQIEAVAPDGYRFYEGPHVLVEPYGRGTTKAEAKKWIRARARVLVKCACEECK